MAPVGRRPKPAFKSKQRKTRWNNQSRRSLNGTCWRSSNARDADSRRAAIDELWDKEGVFIDPGGVHGGSKRLTPLFSSFSRSLKTIVLGPWARTIYAWRRPPSLVVWTADDPSGLRTDVGVTKDGKLTALYVFIDSPSQK